MDQAVAPRCIRHIHIESDALSLDYQAGAGQAGTSQPSWRVCHPDSDVRVTVDHDIDRTLPSSSYAGVWD